MSNKNSILSNTALVVEQYPDYYDGYLFITLIKYKEITYLTIIDNVTDKYVQCYILDRCAVEQISEELLINIAAGWFDRGCQYPISIEFAKHNVLHLSSKILKTCNKDFITRVIGPFPSFDIVKFKNVCRRKRKN